MPLPSLVPPPPDLDDGLLPAASPALAAHWCAFIAATENHFAAACVARGEPFARHTPAELAAVARLAAATGLAPPAEAGDGSPLAARGRS